jgi:ParB family chromosome partitioning protein
MKQALGRGLDALIPSAPAKAEIPAGESVRKISVSQIRPNRLQPRREFAPEGLAALSASIKAHGLAQPIVVCADGGDFFELIAGERRLRATKLAGLSEIDAIVRPALDDTKRLALALIENLQREDLNAMEEASAFQRLITDFGMTQAKIADSLGKSRPAVSNTLRLLELESDIQASIRDGRISEGHGRALLALPEPKRRSVWKRAIVENWSVRRVERASAETDAPKPAARTETSAEARSVESELQKLFGTKVEIKTGAKGKGSVKIHFYSLDDFDRLLGFFKKAAL